MNFIDTHSHLYLKQFNEDFEEVLSRAKESGISKILLPNIDMETVADMHKLVEDNPAIFVPMMGLHPCSVKEGFESELESLELFLKERKYCAVGEIGIDLYWDKSTLGIQQEAFRIQVAWAKKYDLPIVIHARDSFDEIFELMDELNDDSLRGVFHCFTGTLDQAKHILDYENFYLGIGGVVTFKNGGLDKVFPDISLEHVMLETDSPYLAPMPFRGKRNESSYLRYVADRLAELCNIGLPEIAEITTRNAKKLFALT